MIKNTLKGNKGNILQNCVILFGSTYFSFVIYFSLCNTVRFFWIIPILIIIISFVFKRFSNSIKDAISLKEITWSMGRNDERIWLFMSIFLLVFLIQLIYWFAYFPGGFNLDSYGQWDQVHGLMAWNNWHPVLTTMIYWLITRIIDDMAFCILIQLVVFSLSISLLFCDIYMCGVPTYLLYLGALFIGINPAIAMNNVCLIKDVPFAIGTVWMLRTNLRIICSRGEWVKTKKCRIILIVEILFLSLVRHNAIFLVFPYVILLGVVYYCRYQQFLRILFLSIFLLLLVEGPMFSTLGIKQHTNVVGEMVGVPMAAMVNSYVDDYENIPIDVKNFLENIAEDREWKEKYIVGEWDSCKWDFGGIYLFEDESLRHILKMFVSTIRLCPQSTFESLRENTMAAIPVGAHTNTFFVSDISLRNWVNT